MKKVDAYIFCVKEKSDIDFLNSGSELCDILKSKLLTYSPFCVFLSPITKWGGYSFFIFSNKFLNIQKHTEAKYLFSNIQIIQHECINVIFMIILIYQVAI